MSETEAPAERLRAISGSQDDGLGRSSKGVPAWRAFRLLVRSSPWAVFALAVAQVVEGLAPAVVIGASSRLLDRAPAAGTSDDARSAVIVALTIMTAAVVVARVASAALTMLNALVTHRFGAAVDRLRMEAVNSLPGLAHFDDQALADRLQASQWASEAGAMVSYAGFFLRWVSQAGGSAVVAARLGWWAPAIVALTPLPGAIVAWRHIGDQKALRVSLMAPFRKSAYHGQLAVSQEAAREVRLFGMGTWLLDRQAIHWTEAMRPVLADLRRQFRHSLVAAAAKMAVSTVPFVIAYQRFDSGRLSPGDFAAVAVALGTVLMTMRWLESFPAEARAAAQFLPDLFSIVDLPRREPRLVATGTLLPPAVPATGIHFEDVVFSYPGEDCRVLDGLNLWLPTGSSLALVGENGAGKSTVVKLLCRFYDPDEGRITLDGLDVRDLDLEEWRRRIAVVFQDFIRLPLTIAANVGAGCVERVEDRELLAEASRQSGAHEVIERLPDGWETTLAREFGGVDLSGGEWQRVALARAMAARLGRAASVLVLDEPTAALDVRLEHDLYERFGRLTEGLTTLLISHRFSTVRMADRVAVLEAGRVVEEGSHDELVLAAGRYAELYGLQASRFA